MNQGDYASYRLQKYLPSKKIRIVILILVIIGIGYLIIPSLVKKITSLHRANNPATILTLGVAPAGDPTMRDTSGNGIPDWEEAALGIDPYSGSPEANAALFEKLKTSMGQAKFESLTSQTTDSSKVGLVIYGDLTANAATASGTTSNTVVGVTQAEVQNYINANKLKNKTYTAADLTIIDNSSASVQSYYKAQQALGGNIIDKDFVTHLTNYIQGKESKDVYVTSKVATINALAQKILTIPTPSTAVSIELAGANALSGIAQTIDNYDPTNTDSLAQFGTIALIKQYIGDAVTADTNMNVYFSLVLDKSPTSK